MKLPRAARIERKSASNAIVISSIRTTTFKPNRASPRRFAPAMRFGLRLVCYLGGLALLVPASWRLGVAMASASSDPLAMDRLIATAVTVNALLSAAVTAYAAPSLLAALQRAATRPGGSASVPRWCRSECPSRRAPGRSTRPASGRPGGAGCAAAG